MRDQFVATGNNRVAWLAGGRPENLSAAFAALVDFPRASRWVDAGVKTPAYRAEGVFPRSVKPCPDRKPEICVIFCPFGIHQTLLKA